MSDIKKLTIDEVRQHIIALANEPEKLKEYLESKIPFLLGPKISDFSPRQGYAGTLLEIQGSNFATDKKDNEVTVGGKPAEVVYSSPTILKAITELSTGTGSLEVKVGANRASAIYDFKLLPYPKPGVE